MKTFSVLARRYYLLTSLGRMVLSGFLLCVYLLALFFFCRCFAALGDVSTVRFLHQTNQIADKVSQEMVRFMSKQIQHTTVHRHGDCTVCASGALEWGSVTARGGSRRGDTVWESLAYTTDKSGAIFFGIKLIFTSISYYYQYLDISTQTWMIQ